MLLDVYEAACHLLALAMIVTEHAVPRGRSLRGSWHATYIVAAYLASAAR